MGDKYIGNGFSMAILATFAVLWITSCATRPSKMRLNEYGLKVINHKKTLQDYVAIDSNNSMVLLQRFIQPLPVQWDYATVNNFTNQILYKNPLAYLRLPVAIVLKKVSDSLKTLGLGLKIFDAYRPYSVTKKMWQVVPDDNYAANPANGSGHNRGIAVDVTLIDLATGNELKMPTHFDSFSDTAHHSFMQLDSTILKNRNLLKSTMEKFGFKALPTEWWHYSLPEPKRFAILDLSFKKMRKLTSKL